MLQKRVIPCLLLYDKGIVKTVKFHDPVYIGDPINIVRIFNDKEVDEIVFLDISANRNNKGISFNLIKKVADECFIPFAYGGGIKTVDDALRVMNIGAEKVIVNSQMMEDPTFLVKLSDTIGSQSVIASIDVLRSGNMIKLYGFSGSRLYSSGVIEFVKTVNWLGAGEILLNLIDRDGTMKGYDLQLIKSVSEVSKIPVIACGGAGNIEDLRLSFENGASAAAAGSMFVFNGPHRAVLVSYSKDV